MWDRDGQATIPTKYVRSLIRWGNHYRESKLVGVENSKKLTEEEFKVYQDECDPENKGTVTFAQFLKLMD